MADITEEQIELQKRHDALTHRDPLDPLLFALFTEAGPKGVHENVIRDRVSSSATIGTRYIGRLDDYFTATWIENVIGADGIPRDRVWRLTELGYRALEVLSRQHGTTRAKERPDQPEDRPLPTGDETSPRNPRRKGGKRGRTRRQPPGTQEPQTVPLNPGSE